MSFKTKNIFKYLENRQKYIFIKLSTSFLSVILLLESICILHINVQLTHAMTDTASSYIVLYITFTAQFSVICQNMIYIRRFIFYA